MSWERPSPAVAELIRRGVTLLLATPDAIFAEVDRAVFADISHPVARDPVLSDAVRRTNRSNLIHWAQANLADPGAPVAPNPSADALSVGRDLVRRGLDADALHGYRVGQNVAWQSWMALCFELTDDREELQELLQVTARSIFTFVDATLAAITEQIERERDALTRGTHAQRLEVVTLILEGAPIALERASTRLGYALHRDHTAAVVWSTRPDADPRDLERAAAALGNRPLTVLVSASTLWVWTSGEVDLDGLNAAVAELPDVRVALGPRVPALHGFRRSHLDALVTQRLMHRSATAPPVARYDDVQTVALVLQDEERAEEFVQRTLGEFAAAPRELRDTARTYIREGFNTTATARALYTHRNTVLARLARMEELLPAPFAGRGVAVGLALEIVQWHGAPPQ